MADTGLKLPGTAVSVGGGFNEWKTPTSCLTATDTTSAGQGAGQAGVTGILRVTNFGFSIPDESIITGVIVRIRRISAPTGYKDQTVQLSVSGAETGENLAATDNWAQTITSVDYGGAGQLWGLALTPAIVNSSSFGVGMVANRSTSAASVFTIWMQVFFAEGGNTMVRDGGVWKPGQAMVRDGGLWKPGKAMVRDGGVWK